MPYLLNILYLLLLIASSPWLLYSALFKGKYRRGWGAKLFGRVPIRDGDDFCVWFHAVSVGEVNLLQPLIERFEQSHPDWRLVISTTTTTGYELARQKYAPRSVFFCPLDFSWAVKAALRRVRPDLLILAELEIWPNLIRYAGRRAQVAVVNGRLSDRSFRGYGRLRWVLAGTLRRLSLVACQSETYATRFKQLGVESGNVQTTGSLKFDGAALDPHNERSLALAAEAGFSRDDVVFLAGSTQSGEEEAAVRAFQALSSQFPQLRLVLVPRHPQRFDEVAALLDDGQLDWLRRTELSKHDPVTKRRARILLVDGVGELGAWWGTSRIGFVGGSWGRRGGQNMIEPAGYGVAVSFGPRTENFRDIVGLLLAEDAAVVVADEAELQSFVELCLRDSDEARARGQRAQNVVRRHQGAADRTVELIADLAVR